MDFSTVALKDLIPLLDQYAKCGGTFRRDFEFAINGKFHLVSDIQLNKIAQFCAALAQHVVYPTELLELSESIDIYLDYGEDDWDE